MLNNLSKLIISICILIALIAILIIKCGNKKNKEPAFVGGDSAVNNDSVKAALYRDTINFLRGQLDLQKNRADNWQEKVAATEKRADALIAKHKNLDRDKFDAPIDPKYNTIVPNEFIDDCDTCFNILETYKSENKQYKWERDSYDSLMRIQGNIDATRIAELDSEKVYYKRMYATGILDKIRYRDSLLTRKLKISAATISIRNNYVPNGIGGGLIYEDKRANEFGLHFFTSKYGPAAVANFAKTIRLRKK